MKRFTGFCCLAFVAALFAGCCSHRCGPDHGCGRSYWGAYADDPPGCEPCDQCGNWTGGCQNCGRGKTRFSRSGSMGTRMTSLRSRGGSRLAGCRCGRCRSANVESGGCQCESETVHETMQQPGLPMMQNVGYTTVRGNGGRPAGCDCNH